MRYYWLRQGTVSPDCADCGVDTWAIGEVYVVQMELWARYGVGPAWDSAVNAHERACLCIGCLEQRMGRRLTRDDFTGNAVMYEPGRYGGQSARLADRLVER